MAEQFHPGTVGGFVTREVREAGRRTGFRIETFDGLTEILAHVAIRSRHKVSRYGVDVEALDRVVTRALHGAKKHRIYLVDEIGKMECFSGLFRRRVSELLETQVPVLCTIAARGGGFIAEVKRRSDVELWTLDQASRDRIPARLSGWLAERMGTRGEDCAR